MYVNIIYVEINYAQYKYLQSTRHIRYARHVFFVKYTLLKILQSAQMPYNFSNFTCHAQCIYSQKNNLTLKEISYNTPNIIHLLFSLAMRSGTEYSNVRFDVDGIVYMAYKNLLHKYYI